MADAHLTDAHNYCWDSKPELAKEFTKRYHYETVKNYYEMVDKVDAMIFTGFYEVKWWPPIQGLCPIVSIQLQA